MTHYEKGRRFEWKTRDDLTDNGYDVLRAAGSKGGTKVDLIAFKPGQQLLIQCKENGTLPPAEWNRIVEVAYWVGAIPLLAANGPKGRGVVYTRLLGPKTPRARLQPCEPFLLDEIAAAPSNPLYDPRCNRDLPIPGAGCNRERATCRYPECTYADAARPAALDELADTRDPAAATIARLSVELAETRAHRDRLFADLAQGA